MVNPSLGVSLLVRVDDRRIRSSVRPSEQCGQSVPSTVQLHIKNLRRLFGSFSHLGGPGVTEGDALLSERERREHSTEGGDFRTLSPKATPFPPMTGPNG